MPSPPLCFFHYWLQAPAFRLRSGIAKGKSSSIYHGVRMNRSALSLNRCSDKNHIDVNEVEKNKNGHPVDDFEISETSKGVNDQKKVGKFSSNEILQKLKRYGVSGVLSYGLLNTVYYLTTFLLVWFYFAPAPGKMGYKAAAERFLKIMAMVWAGSQVTKIVRAGGALALAPFVAKGLSWFTARFKFESEGKAFVVIVGVCFTLALFLFLGLTLLWS